jgi:hypothetical protein
MNESGSKSVTKAAASVAASATHSHEIDTKGFKYATIDVVYSPFTAATGAYASVCKVQEHDVTATGQTDVTGLTLSLRELALRPVPAMSARWLVSTSICGAASGF